MNCVLDYCPHDDGYCMFDIFISFWQLKSPRDASSTIPNLLVFYSLKILHCQHSNYWTDFSTFPGGSNELGG